MFNSTLREVGMDKCSQWIRAALGLPALGGLLLTALALLIAWSFAVPIFEAPDEPDHWQYVLYVHQNSRLPIYGVEFIEANSPPLYYVLMAPFATSSDLPQKLEPEGPRPWTRLVHFQYSFSDFAKYWPLRIIRLITALLSVLTVLFCYWASFEASSNHVTGLLAAGLVAFLPQFTFRGMNISNDALVTMFCAAASYLIVRIAKRGFTWPVGLLAALAMALAFLSKISAIFMPVPFAFVVLSDAAPWRTRFRRLGVLVLGLALVIPWVLGNQILYGDPFASRAMLTAVPDLVSIKPITSEYFAVFFPLVLFHSFIGGFGWMNLWMPEWLYLLFGSWMFLSLIGYVVCWLRRCITSRLAIALLTMPVLSILITFYINLTFDQPQGRYLFPALPALAVIGAVGMTGILGRSKLVAVATLGVLVLLNIYILVTVIVPAYWASV